MNPGNHICIYLFPYFLTYLFKCIFIVKIITYFKSHPPNLLLVVNISHCDYFNTQVRLMANGDLFNSMLFIFLIIFHICKIWNQPRTPKPVDHLLVLMGYRLTINMSSFPLGIPQGCSKNLAVESQFFKNDVRLKVRHNFKTCFL